LERSLFEKWMFEAPGDDPPVEETETPPDVPADPPAEDPPDINPDEEAPADDMGDDPPPDIGDMDGSEETPEEENPLNNKDIGEKLSSVLNANLYQSYLELLTQIDSQLTSIKNNSDLLYTLSNETADIVNSLRKLDENLRLYISNSFMNNRYEKNLLFYNKCKNLCKLLNDKFDIAIHKGIKETQ